MTLRVSSSVVHDTIRSAHHSELAKKMNYHLYCSCGNTLNLDEYVCYSEIGEDGYWVRYVEVKADGTALRYDETHPSDEFGILPEGKWDEVESTKPEYGVVTRISKHLFEAIWDVTHCNNERQGI